MWRSQGGGGGFDAVTVGDGGAADSFDVFGQQQQQAGKAKGGAGRGGR